jgi:hypothetical protein
MAVASPARSATIAETFQSRGDRSSLRKSEGVIRSRGHFEGPRSRIRWLSKVVKGEEKVRRQEGKGNSLVWVESPLATYG